VGGALQQVPEVDFYRIPEVPEGRLASVLLDSPESSEVGASLIAAKKTSYLCTLPIVPPPDSALKMRNQ
jgi:hypothetical protein